MQSIDKYKEFIKLIPVDKQSARVKKDVWDRFRYNDIERIVDEIFATETEVEISREDVLNENDPKKRIVMTLMWGYPTGGRGSNIDNILHQLDYMETLLLQVKNKSLTKDEANALTNEFMNIRGLGISTWSKLLYFYNVEIESKRCQIYDSKIVGSLNKKQFSELVSQNWKQDVNHYYKYIKFADDLAKRICARPDQVELFLFSFNHSYKF